jgi:hypothetical protein
MQPMDMQLPAIPQRSPGESFATHGTAYIRLAEQREYVLALIAEFQKFVAARDRLNEAIRTLQAIVPCCGAYFSLVESLMDKLAPAGGTPHRNQHRQILAAIRDTVDRCSAGIKPDAIELTHVLDALVIHEAAKKFPEV